MRYGEPIRARIAPPGSNSDTRMPMIVMTTSSSTSVNPRGARTGALGIDGLPHSASLDRLAIDHLAVVAVA